MKTNALLIESIRRRDAATLKAVFAEVNPYLVKICCSHKIFGELSQDIIQKSWETFFKNFEQFKGQSQIKVFMAGIMINKIREHRRESKKIFFSDDAENALENAFTLDGWWNQSPPDPSQIIESKQAAKSIEECLEGLTESQRDVFLLKEVHDEESQNICNIVGISVSHLGVLLFRAKDKLRKCLDGKVGVRI